MAAVTHQPGEGPFDDLPLGKHDEPLGLRRAEHHLQQPAKGLGDPLGQAAAAISRVGEHPLQPLEPLLERQQREARPVLILPAGASPSVSTAE